MYGIMELYSLFAFLTSLAVPASSQNNLKSNTRDLHSANGTELACWMTWATVIDGHLCSAFEANNTFS